MQKSFFAVQHVQQSAKVRLAFISMEGNALHWFQYWKQKTKRKNWFVFKAALIKRYGGIGRGDVYEHLATLHQTGTATEFIQEFKVLVAQVSGTKEA